MGLDSVLTAIAEAVTAAINAAGITQPGQVYKGWPTATEIVKVLGQPNAQWMVSVYPHNARNATRWIENDAITSRSFPAAYLSATVVGNSMTITGAGAIPVGNAPINVHAFMHGVNADVYAVAHAGDSDTMVASGIAQAVNALGLPGISAVNVANDVVLTGAVWDFANFGGTGSYAFEATRVARQVQITIWTTGDPTDPLNIDNSLRFSILDAIVGLIGTRQNHFITDSTETVVFILYASDIADDESESSYSLYASHVFFNVEYTAHVIVPATQVGVVEPTTTVQTPTTASVTNTEFIGGQS